VHSEKNMSNQNLYDLAIIGGGINGVGIARDAAGRGLSVYLCEQNDLASATSSASSKLLHGGLRYLEHYDFTLVREALHERDVLLKTAPHITHPLRFVLPVHEGNRPYWMLWAGLKLYDTLGGASHLPRSSAIRLEKDETGVLLKRGIGRGLAYWDGWVDDARLVVLCAMDAHERGAAIRTRCTCVKTTRTATHWEIETHQAGRPTAIQARILVNAAGAQTDAIDKMALGEHVPRRTRLVRGSHIIVPKLFGHESAYILQHTDKRLIFMLPYEQNFTLIGTTDVEVSPEMAIHPRMGFDEQSYLLEAVNRYLNIPLHEEHIIDSFSGIRSLYADGSDDAQSNTRDYMLALDDRGAPLLSVIGGKITTHRKLAEEALNRLAPFTGKTWGWTVDAVLPGGDLPAGGMHSLISDLRARYPYMEHGHLARLARLYGTRSHVLLADVASAADVGEHLGGDLTACEVNYLIRFEWARTAQDVLWRRTKLGLQLPESVSPRLYEVMAQANQRRR
jgi:glycerol-3-phosphate dehydrogenase